MCDYSLAHFPNRLAVEGEQLVVHRFSSGSHGLASPDRGFKELVFRCSTTAVCVPPGARLLLREIPKILQDQISAGEVEEVTFVEQSAEAFRYRDAVRFSNGREILLQHLPCGVRVDVLRLDSAETTEAQPELQRAEPVLVHRRSLGPRSATREPGFQAEMEA
jgi:hypothetical protein